LNSQDTIRLPNDTEIISDLELELLVKARLEESDKNTKTFGSLEMTKED